MAQLRIGINDLQTLFPHIANEADGWAPNSVTAGSSKKMRWRCKSGHIWLAKVNDRTPPQGNGCPYCGGHKVLSGSNDLATLFPEIAAEADGWNAYEILPKSHRKMPWQCIHGHRWEATVANRTPPNSSSCPFCSGRKAISGKTDLLSVFPDIAGEAEGWNPSSFSPKSHKRLKWRCALGHTWIAEICKRTPPESQGCPICSGHKALYGFNDLATLCPDVAHQADGWDPRSVTLGSNQRCAWICDKGHRWMAKVNDRTPPQSQGCPVCAGRQVLPGFNDLATKYPRLASEAEGWNPTRVTCGSSKSLAWRCTNNHIWVASVCSRTPPRNGGCPVCQGRKVQIGFNDLASQLPQIASQAHGWDPTTVTVKSNKLLQWICDKGHIWSASVANRTPPTSSGCPVCSEHGFNPDKQAWLYLLEREHEQQIGITNFLEDRLSTHGRVGWREVDIIGPHAGQKIFSLERSFKQYLRINNLLVPGTRENWYTSSFHVASISELAVKCAILIPFP
jgi:hypothetical protein